MSTEDTAELPTSSTEDTTMLRSVTRSLPCLNRCTTIGIIYSKTVEDGKGWSATGGVLRTRQEQENTPYMNVNSNVIRRSCSRRYGSVALRLHY